MNSLKNARKEAREYMNNSGWSCCFINFSKAKGFYFTKDKDNYSVYFCHKDGSLEELNKTEYARNFHRSKRGK